MTRTSPFRYLLYCVCHDRGLERRRPIRGVAGRRIYTIASGGLGAVVSRVRESDLLPDIPRVLAYEKVVESFHRNRSVIPMGYGCVFCTKEEVAGFLERHCGEYKALLKSLENMVEIGIRILIDNGGHEPSNVEPEDSAAPAAGAGAAYLVARRNCYAATDGPNREAQRAAALICREFSSLFVRRTEEFQTLRGRQVLSLYFLVPRHRVPRFRETFHRVRLRCRPQLLLSGPWPPYNFVCPGGDPRTSESRDGW